jgi:dye decolorizing peroxidase
MTDASTGRTAGVPDRRTVLLSGLTGLAGAGALAGLTATGAGAQAGAAATAPADQRGGPTRIARGFRGARQAGIVEPPQPYAAFVALDLAPGVDRDAVRRLLTVWTDDIERLTAGRGTLTDLEPELAAVPASLTVTLGIGPAVVAAAGAPAPSWLAPLPGFGIDRLQERWSGGDLILQICADSPVTVAHAQRRLLTSAGDLASLRWVQRGFREPYSGPGTGTPMRNLLGQVDGTVQPATTGPDDALLWAGADAQPPWLAGGSSMVVRRIAMKLDAWDGADRVARENAIGRRLDTGAPLTAPDGSPADTPADLRAIDENGFGVIDEFAHLRRAHPAAPEERFLRRPYNYDDPPAAGATSDSGLVFVTFQADPVRQFVPVQRRLAQADLLNLWTTPVGSAVFAVLPGAREDEILGQAMLA